MAATGVAVWVAFGNAGTIARIDPATNRVVTIIDVGNGPYDVTATSEAVWVANDGDWTVSHIDPAHNEVVDTIRLGISPTAVAATGDAAWVTPGAPTYDDEGGTENGGTVSRIAST